MTAKSASALRRANEALERFRVAFDSFMDIHVEGDTSGLGLGYSPTCWPAESADPKEVQQRTEEVARCAGLCSNVASLTGSTMMVQGVGPVDPIANWDTMLRPKAFLWPSELKRICARAAGVLERLVADAEDQERAAPLPVLGPTSLHPVVWKAAAPFWTVHQLRAAVREAAEAVITHAKACGVRNNIADTSVWQQLFSEKAAEEGRPRLRWPGDPKDLAVKTMQDGLRQFAPGVQMVIRNPVVHHTGEFSEQIAFEYLATLSVLQRFVEECEIVQVDHDEAMNG